MHASGYGYQEIVQLLLAKGGDVNAKTDKGMTALMLATIGGHPEVVQLLLAKGADVNVKTNDGMTALMFTAPRDSPPKVGELLIRAGAKWP